MWTPICKTVPEHPYTSTLIDMWLFQETGRNRIKRVTFGGFSEWYTTELRSLFATNSYKKNPGERKASLITKRACWSKKFSASNMKVDSQHSCRQISDSRWLQDPDCWRISWRQTNLCKPLFRDFFVWTETELEQNWSESSFISKKISYNRAKLATTNPHRSFTIWLKGIIQQNSRWQIGPVHTSFNQNKKWLSFCNVFLCMQFCFTLATLCPASM